MHSTETINQFLNLRVQGWSFARIADQLHVSKPTLLAWNRKYHSNLDSMKATQERTIQQTSEASQFADLQNLTMFYSALRRELVSRTLQNFSNEEIETLAGDIESQIHNLTGEEPGLPSAPFLAKERPPSVVLLTTEGPTQSDPVKPSPTKSNHPSPSR
jgi:hypothetical protein